MRCNCGFPINPHMIGHAATCAIYDMCAWCNSNMGSELGDIHQKCKPLFKEAIQALARWAERKMK